MARESLRDSYDAVLDFWPLGGKPGFAYALVKRTYDFSHGVCRLAAPVPLQHDTRDPELEPRQPPGSDFFPFKVQTDVVVLGSAYAVGAPRGSMDVGLRVGNRHKRVRVFGDRQATWDAGGRASFSSPEPFEEMPLTNDRAYGGCDARAPLPPTPTPLDELALELQLTADHPGVYPRNPFGCGYVLEAAPEPIALPNLEDPDDLLWPARIAVGDPRTWYRQPIPRTFGWWYTLMFPRFAFLGVRPWYAAPDGLEIAEVQRGWLPRDYATAFGAEDDDVFDRRFFQEAPPDQVFSDLAPETPIEVEGMHPERQKLGFLLPSPPRLGLRIEGQREDLPPRLSAVIIEPHKTRVSCVYAASTDSFPRALIPGVHKVIDMELTVDGDAPIPYETPVPIRDRLAEANENAT